MGFGLDKGEALKAATAALQSIGITLKQKKRAGTEDAGEPLTTEYPQRFAKEAVKAAAEQVYRLYGEGRFREVPARRPEEKRRDYKNRLRRSDPDAREALIRVFTEHRSLGQGIFGNFLADQAPL